MLFSAIIFFNCFFNFCYTKRSKSEEKRMKATEIEYRRRIQLVQDYIESNLCKSLTVGELAQIAGFSKYHFHRIFTSIVEETMVQYIQRLKIERAAYLLMGNNSMSITDIAYHFGFSDSAIFSRMFKLYYGVSPSTYRKQNSKKSKETIFKKIYHQKIGIEMDETSFEVEIEISNIEPIDVVYIRHTGSYESLSKEFKNMGNRLLSNLQESKVVAVYAIYHDNHEITDKEHLRTSLCIEKPKNFYTEDPKIGEMQIAGGMYAIGHFRIKQDQFPAIWKYMYGKWLWESGFEPRDSIVFEKYVINPENKHTDVYIVDIYLPITI